MHFDRQLEKVDISQYIFYDLEIGNGEGSWKSVKHSNTGILVTHS